jgi:F-type H+-transporting ATPase subunit epsilon
MKTLRLDFVTRRERVYQGDVRTVAVPAWKGAMGVLPGHAPFLGLLRPGLVTVRTGKEKLSFPIAGGTVQVLPDSVTILAEEAAGTAR